MPARKNLIPSAHLHLRMREDLRAQLDLLLFSEVEGRVPKDGYKSFFEARVSEFLNSRQLDLAPWADVAPGTLLIRGSPEAVRVLQKTLNELGDTK